MSRGRWAFVALAAGIAAAVALAIVVPGEVQESEPVLDRNQQRAGASYRDRASRFAVEVPAGWRRARGVVIGEVANPREILVASTFPVASSGEPCGPFYDHVLGRMGRREALVAVQERLGRSVAGPREFRPRPTRFRLPVGAPQRRGCGRNRGRRLTRDWWIPFRDAGRDFYAQVAIGVDAPRQIRRDSLRLLDSLRFERRRAASSPAGSGPGD